MLHGQRLDSSSAVHHVQALGAGALNHLHAQHRAALSGVGYALPHQLHQHQGSGRLPPGPLQQVYRHLGAQNPAQEHAPAAAGSAGHESYTPWHPGDRPTYGRPLPG
jgi:hypothetical protein